MTRAIAPAEDQSAALDGRRGSGGPWPRRLERWTRKDIPSPEARALELALSVPTSSDYEATAIYQAAIFQGRWLQVR